MSMIAPKSGTGIDRRTGQVLDGFAHVVQSIEVIFSTRFGERVMRRDFGSYVPGLLGRNMVESSILAFWSAICIAIDLWEPRFRVTKIAPVATTLELRDGRIGFNVTGIYRPNALLGDFTPETTLRTLIV